MQNCKIEKTGKRIRYISVLAILIGAYCLRVLYPNLYMTGGDMPGHIMASMRLHLTSIFEIQDRYNSFFAQILSFNHGYTTITLPYLLYEIFFTVFKQTITEVKLVYIHSFIGIISLLSIFYFAKLNFGFKIAFLTLLIMAVIPIHIGHSRVHIGMIIIQITFFYSGLSFLSKYLSDRREIWRLLYYVTVFFYIGSDNAFIVGLVLHIFYTILVLSNLPWHSKVARLRDIYFNRYAIIFIALPIFTYLGVTAVSYQIVPGRGYLLRLLTKVDALGLSLDILKVLKWIIELIGPVTIPFFISLFMVIFYAKNTRGNPQILFLCSVFLTYFSLLSITDNIQRNFVFFLAVPVVTIACLTLIRWPISASLTICATLIYSLSVVYNLNIGFPTTQNYGSINHLVKNNDFGIKTLGYLIRIGELDVSAQSRRVGVFLDYEGAWYYIGAWFHDWVIRDIQNGALEEYETFVLAYLNNVQRDRNRYILDIVRERNLKLVGYIVDGDKILIELYSNKAVDDIKRYDTNVYNEKFDREFGTLDQFPKTWLGHF